MKKMLTLLVLAVFLLSAAGCGSAQEADVPAQHATANAQSAPPALKTKVLFINTSRDPNGNTYKMGEAFLAGVPHDTLFLNDYKVYQLGQHYDDDRLTDVLAATEQADTIVIGTPVYWHTMSGALKTFIDRTVLFLHGGGYIGGLHGRYLDWGLHQGDLVDAGTLFAVDYRLAPEHTYPAALEDAVTAYRAILKAGTDPQQIVLVGDSAGGNLAAALLLSLRDNKMPLPKAAILISPWGYLGSDLPSHMNNIPKDQVLGAKNVRLGGEVAHPSYRKDAPVTDPYISPVYADLTGLPPMLITAGGDELFLDDAALLAAHATAAGVPVQFTIYPRMSHDWTLLLPELPESAAMDAEIRQFVDAQLKR